MAISNLVKQGVGFDPREYTRFAEGELVYSTSPLSTGVYGTAYSVTGKGRIDAALFYQTNAQAGNATAQILVDGSVIYEGSLYIDSSAGICLGDLIIGGYTLGVSYAGRNDIRLGSPKSYSLPYSGSGLAVILSSPIFFKSSFEIKVKRNSSNTPSVSIAILGGLE